MVAALGLAGAGCSGWVSSTHDGSVSSGEGDEATASDGSSTGDEADSGATADDDDTDDTALPGGVARPFPQALEHHGIKPSHVDQAQLDDAVRAMYGRWKRDYLRVSSGATPGGGYYIEMTGTGAGADTSITTSEAHGYGMIIFALMAGHEPDARAIFDGFFNMFDQHRSVVNDANMSWIIAADESPEGDSGSATDGDLDIAYALLLADVQWGSGGAVDYAGEAQRVMLDGVLGSLVKWHNLWLRLGDWDGDDDFGTRSSDWMVDHLRAFAAATEGEEAQAFRDMAGTVYAIIDALQAEHSPATGLVPDFVLDQWPPHPAPEGYLDEPFVDFSENACRLPWRLAMDWGLYGTLDAKRVLDPMVEFVRAETGDRPELFLGRYHLDGTPQDSVAHSVGRMAYVAPMVSAATIDATHQVFLDRGWDVLERYVYDEGRGKRVELDAQHDDAYFDDTLLLLNLLYISGNWWRPDDEFLRSVTQRDD